MIDYTAYKVLDRKLKEDKINPYKQKDWMDLMEIKV